MKSIFLMLILCIFVMSPHAAVSDDVGAERSMEAAQAGLNRVMKEKGHERQKRGEKVDIVAIQDAILRYAADFPDDDGVASGTAGHVLEYAGYYPEWRMDEAEQRAFLQAMKASPSAKLRALASGKEEVARLRREPLALKVKSLGGSEIDIAAYRGKVVLVDFWGTTCSVCIEDMPRIKAVYEKYRSKGFEVIGIVFDDLDDPARSRAVIQKQNTPWPQSLQDHWTRSPLYQRFGFSYVPNYFLLSRDGLLAMTDVELGHGNDLAVKLDHAVQGLLGGAPAMPPAPTVVPAPAR